MRPWYDPYRGDRLIRRFEGPFKYNWHKNLLVCHEARRAGPDGESDKEQLRHSFVPDDFEELDEEIQLGYYPKALPWKDSGFQTTIGEADVDEYENEYLIGPGEVTTGGGMEGVRMAEAAPSVPSVPPMAPEHHQLLHHAEAQDPAWGSG